MCQKSEPHLCHYHSLIQLRRRIVHRINVCNAAILHSPRHLQSIEIFNHRLDIREKLYQELAYVDKGLKCLEDANATETSEAMYALADAGVSFIYAHGQIIITPLKRTFVLWNK